jgi:16S rRNA (cytosine1402-N4)-methyltransferase
MYHRAVLLHESVEGLGITADGVYIDATFGGGGHSRVILAQLGAGGRLIAFDRDPDAAANAPDDKRFSLIAADFRHIQRFLRLHGITQVDGILADLGVSSHQFDTPDRGFSYRYEGPLDMRMNPADPLSAAEVLNTYHAEQLQDMFSKYGEVRNARTLALGIVERRAVSPYRSTADLRITCELLVKGEIHRYLAQVYQALRMEVNDELGSLEGLLQAAAQVLKPGGRLAVITFHSLEDRLVKNYMRHGTAADEPAKDLYGNYDMVWKLITRKPITATADELKTNSRSQSAKLRIASKV